MKIVPTLDGKINIELTNFDTARVNVNAKSRGLTPRQVLDTLAQKYTDNLNDDVQSVISKLTHEPVNDQQV